jgi:hypothetical protein
MGGLASVRPGAELDGLSMGGWLRMKSHLKAVLKVQEGRRLVDAALQNVAVVDGFDADIAAKWTGEEPPVRLKAGVESLDAIHHFAAQCRAGSRLEIQTNESFTVVCEQLTISNGEAEMVSVGDLLVSGSAFDQLDESLSLDLGLRARAGELTMGRGSGARIRQPARFDVQVAARDLLRPRESMVVVRGVEGRMGSLLPVLSVSGMVEGLGIRNVWVGGTVMMDVEEALKTRDALGEGLAAASAGLQAVGWARGDFEVQGEPFSSGEDAAVVGASVTTRTRHVALKRPDHRGDLGPSTLAAALDLDLQGGLRPERIWWASQGRVDGAEVQTPRLAGDVHGIQWDLSGTAEGPQFENLRVGYDAELSDVSVTPGAGAGPAEQVRAALSALSARGEVEAQMQEGHYSVTSAGLRVDAERGTVLEVSVPRLTVRDSGRAGLQGRAFLRAPEVEALLELVPPAYGEILPQISGAVEASVDFDGPPPFLAEASVEDESNEITYAGGVPSEIALLDIEKTIEHMCPRKVEAGVRLDNFSVLYELAPDVRVGLHQIGGRAKVIRDGASLRAELGLMGERAVIPGQGPQSGKVVMESRLELQDYDRFRVTETTFRALDGAVTGGLKAEVRGLSTWGGESGADWVLNHLDGHADWDIGISPGVLDDLLSGWQGSGHAGLTGRARLAGGEHLDVEMTGELREFDLAIPGVGEIRGLNARVPLAKSWSLGEAAAGGQQAPLSELSRVPGGRRGEAAARTAWRMGGLQPAMSRMVEPEPDLGIDSISADGRALVKSVRIDARRVGSGLELNPVWMEVLEGNLLGRAVGWTVGDDLHLRAEAEYDGINTQVLLPPALAVFPGDSTLAGNVRLGFDLQGASGSRPIQGMFVRLNVTRIGSAALDQALWALDPDAENPGIVQIRSRLGLTTPRRMRVELERGFLSLGVDLRGVLSNIVTHYSVPRFNVSNLLGRERWGEYRTAFGRMGGLRFAIDALAADHIAVTDKTGELKFLQKTPNGISQ